MKKAICMTISAALLLFCAACGGTTAKQKGVIGDITKGYFAGLEDASAVTIHLDDYVEANGTNVTYTVTSGNPEIATVELDGSVLTATLCGDEGDSLVTVTVNSNGKKAFNLYFTLTATVYERVACIGDSLTYGHSWHNQSYPVYLQELLGDGVEVQNFGVNGSAVTNRSESNYKLKYDTLKEYQDSIAFAPDIAIIMLGTNDGYNWTGSEPTFVEEYEKLIGSYLENGAKQIVLMTSPPTLENNAFNLPNDIIKAEVCPRQRALAEEFELPLVDLRTVFEARDDLESLYRPGDGVHFSVDGAQLVAQLAAETVKKL